MGRVAGGVRQPLLYEGGGDDLPHVLDDECVSGDGVGGDDAVALAADELDGDVGGPFAASEALVAAEGAGGGAGGGAFDAEGAIVAAVVGAGRSGTIGAGRSTAALTKLRREEENGQDGEEERNREMWWEMKGTSSLMARWRFREG